MFSYSIYSRRTGEWLGAVRGVDSAVEAVDQWIASFGVGSGMSVGYTAREVRAERLPADAPVSAA